MEANGKMSRQDRSEKKQEEIENHILRLLDALVEMEERITSLEKTRDLLYQEKGSS